MHEMTRCCESAHLNKKQKTKQKAKKEMKQEKSLLGWLRAVGTSHDTCNILCSIYPHALQIHF